MTHKTTRTSEGLRSVLFDTLDQFLNNQIDAGQAKTVAKLADTLLKSVEVDLEHRKLVNSMTSGGAQQAIANLSLNIEMAPLAKSETQEVSIPDVKAVAAPAKPDRKLTRIS
jgi:hypothetical protein